MHYVQLTIFPSRFNNVYEMNLLFFLKLYYIFVTHMFFIRFESANQMLREMNSKIIEF